MLIKSAIIVVKIDAGISPPAGARVGQCKHFNTIMEASFMDTPRRTADEQYKLIMECRSSGLTDYQWCIEHDINPGTFYNWVKRLRKKACYDIPPATGRGHFAPMPKQDVVKLDILPDAPEPMAGIPLPADASSFPPITVSIGSATIHVHNDADPVLLARLIKAMGTYPC